MQNISNAQVIDQCIRQVRRLFSLCAERFAPFDSEIVRVLQLHSIANYSSLIDCFYLFEDTELAKAHIRQTGLVDAKAQPDFGLVYLKFYGLMNACYLQQQGVIVCTKILQLSTELNAINASRIIQFRNDFAAHSANRRSGRVEHSYILDRFGLIEGRVAGYTANSDCGLSFRNAPVEALLAEWDEAFRYALAPVCERIVSLILAAGVCGP